MARTEQLYQTARWRRPSDYDKDRFTYFSAKAALAQAAAELERIMARVLEGRHRRRPAPPSRWPRASVESMQDHARSPDRPRPGRRRGPPAQRPARPVRRHGLARSR